MNPRVALAASIGGIAVFCLLIVRAASNVYFQPRAKLLDEIAVRQTTLESRNQALEQGPRIAAELEAFGHRTLGRDAETVDHMLRSRLNQVVQAIALQHATVGTGKRTARTTPARKRFTGRTPSAIEARERVDFVEVEAWVDGHGTLAQVIELIDRIEAEPWIKKVTSVRLEPQDNGSRVGVNVKLVTLFLPGRAPNAELLDAHVYDRAMLDRYAALVEVNPFRVPPPRPVEAAPAVVVQKEPQKPPAFPYGQWSLTGVAVNIGGAEVWLRHRQSGETRRLAPGEGLHEVVFVAPRGDDAVFEVHGDRFVVALGDSMDKRSPIQ